MSPYLSDEAQFKRLKRLRQAVLMQADERRNCATRVRNADNTADGERIAERWEALAREAEADAEMLKRIADEQLEAEVL